MVQRICYTTKLEGEKTELEREKCYVHSPQKVGSDSKYRLQKKRHYFTSAYFKNEKVILIQSHPK